MMSGIALGLVVALSAPLVIVAAFLALAVAADERAQRRPGR